MLQMKDKCERCGTSLPLDSEQALICSYECTFCADCNEDAFHGVCPNCKGDLKPRPTRMEKR
jgi:hypothetical protein